MTSLLAASVFAFGLWLPSMTRANGFGDGTSAPGSNVTPIDDTFASRRAPPPAPKPQHVTPRLKLSYVRFSVGDGEGGAVPLEALHLDMYTLSWRWLRAGVEAEAGRGNAKVMGAATSLKFGTLGVGGGLQLPGRITPFVEGRLAFGVMAGTLEEDITVPGTTATVSGASAATWIYARGLDAGAEIYAFGRSYLSTSLGWVRSTWRGADYASMTGVTFKDVGHDSFLLKLGVGI
jgi:hypothetical protein